MLEKAKLEMHARQKKKLSQKIDQQHFKNNETKKKNKLDKTTMLKQKPSIFDENHFPHTKGDNGVGISITY